MAFGRVPSREIRAACAQTAMRDSADYRAASASKTGAASPSLTSAIDPTPNAGRATDQRQAGTENRTASIDRGGADRGQNAAKNAIKRRNASEDKETANRSKKEFKLNFNKTLKWRAYAF